MRSLKACASKSILCALFFTKSQTFTNIHHSHCDSYSSSMSYKPCKNPGGTLLSLFLYKLLYSKKQCQHETGTCFVCMHERLPLWRPFLLLSQRAHISAPLLRYLSTNALHTPIHAQTSHARVQESEGDSLVVHCKHILFLFSNGMLYNVFIMKIKPHNRVMRDGDLCFQVSKNEYALINSQIFKGL